LTVVDAGTGVTDISGSAQVAAGGAVTFALVPSVRRSSGRDGGAVAVRRRAVEVAGPAATGRPPARVGERRLVLRSRAGRAGVGTATTSAPAAVRGLVVATSRSRTRTAG
jgi:hypothetical protein